MEEDKGKVSETKTDEGEDLDKKGEPSQPDTRTEKEKAAHNLQRQAQRLVDAGGDPAEVLGIKQRLEDTEGDEIPEWYKKMQQADTKKSLDTMVSGITDADLRAAVDKSLKEDIKPSGDPQADFKKALSIASASKNKQVIEEVGRYTAPRTTAPGGSSPTIVTEEFVPTAQETVFMQPPYNLSKEKILEARKKEEAKQK